MLQREVAERISAAPGDMSYLSVFVQYHANVRIVRRVPREAFEPAPEVESAVIELTVRPGDGEWRLPDEMEDDLWRLVQAGFRERRKMLHNVLRRQLPIEPERVDAAGAGHRRRVPAPTSQLNLRARQGSLASGDTEGIRTSRTFLNKRICPVTAIHRAGRLVSLLW